MNVLNELITALKDTGLSDKLSIDIAELISRGISDITPAYTNDVMIGRLKKVKKAIQVTLLNTHTS